VFSLGIYDGVLKDAIGLFKYRAKLVLAKPFAKLLIEFAESFINMERYDIIVPVPLHSAKFREREFNQAEFLAEPVAKKFGIPYSRKVLLREKVTPPQSYLKKSERLKNLKNAFRTHNTKVAYRKKILLVDDVFTTGATANECAKVLVDSGAKNVSVLTLARGE